MVKTTLDAQLVTTGLNHVFYHLKSVDCERSDLWKSFGLDANEKNERLDFPASACQACLQALRVGQDLQLFLQLPTASEILRIYVVRCFSWLQKFYIATFFFFAFNFLLQLSSSRPIAQNVKALFKKHVLELF